jgi:hypothetical protein
MEQFLAVVERASEIRIAWAMLLLLAALVLAHEIGWRSGDRRRAALVDKEGASIGVIVGGTLGLLAFVLGFSISLADNRFEARRVLVLQEANAIGTAWLRAGVVGGEEGPRIQAQLVRYTELRLAYSEGWRERDPALRAARQGVELQTEMWSLATAVAQRSPTPVSALLLAALNDVFDAATAQHYAHASRVPAAIVALLLVGSVISAATLGFQVGLGGQRHLVLSAALMVLWAAAIMIVVDFNRPRDGLVRVDPAPLEWTLRGFGPPR